MTLENLLRLVLAGDFDTVTIEHIPLETVNSVRITYQRDRRAFVRDLLPTDVRATDFDGLARVAYGRLTSPARRSAGTAATASR